MATAQKSPERNAPIASGDENWEEVTAWNRVLLHARRFSHEELEQAARTDLTFFDLYTDGRVVRDGRTYYDGPREYKLALVLLEGRLIQLKSVEPSRKLRDAGVGSDAPAIK